MIADILHRVAGMEPDDHGEYRPRPSMAGPERCIRQMTYQRIGQATERETGDRFLHVLSDSSWHEELTGDWLGKTAYELHSRQMGVTLPGVFKWLDGPMFSCKVCNQKIHPSHLHGHIDGVLTDPLLIDRLYEHKAINHFTFESLWDQRDYPEDYFAQTAIYLRALQQINPDLKEAILLIKNKNTSGFVEYLLRYDNATDYLAIVTLTRHTGESVAVNLERPNIVMAALDKFAAVESHAVAGTLPPRPYDSDHWRCNYCPFREACWKGYMEELTSLSENAELEPELADELRYYKQLGAEINEQTKEREGLRDKIIAALKTAGAKSGKAGEYAVSLTATPKRTVRWEDVPFSITQALEAYKTTTISETLRVTTPKAKTKERAA